MLDLGVPADEPYWGLPGHCRSGVKGLVQMQEQVLGSIPSPGGSCGPQLTRVGLEGGQPASPRVLCTLSPSALSSLGQPQSWSWGPSRAGEEGRERPCPTQVPGVQ